LAGDDAVEFFLAVGEATNLRRVARPLEDVRDDELVALAEAADEMVSGKRELLLCGELFPGAFMGDGGVDDDPVPIKDGDGTAHGSVLIPVEGDLDRTMLPNVEGLEDLSWR
jgi:hypothetical protein